MVAFRALPLVLAFVALPWAPARAQGGANERAPIQVSGALDGQPLQGTLTPERRQGREVLVARLGPWSGEGALVRGNAWLVRLVRQDAAGAAGRLLGKESGPARPTTLILFRRPEGASASVFRDGKVVGRLAEPAAPPKEPPLGLPVGEPRPLTRNAWYARHATAALGVARAIWDFFKPGSKRLEELRGDTTQAQTAALKQDLDRAPKPLTPATIFRAARRRAGSDRAALELCFGLLVDERRLELRQLPGIEAGAPIHDKYEHFFASAILAHRSNATGSFTVGWMKEVLDSVTGSGYSEEDLMADALGAEFGQGLLEGRVIE